jgi:hypothetical protein
MPKHRISKYAVCPYYLHEDSQVIYCEGIVPDSVIHLAFANKTDAKAYKCKYCRKCYGECLISQLLEEANEYE